jgi:hypothetical protein
MTALWLLAFVLVLLGGLAVFLLLEAIALVNQDDKLDTFSAYVKRARRRCGIAGSVVLGLVILVPAAWLFGHLVLELW